MGTLLLFPIQAQLWVGGSHLCEVGLTPKQVEQVANHGPATRGPPQPWAPSLLRSQEAFESPPPPNCRLRAPTALPLPYGMVLKNLG